jgi:nucleotide-binding universal stress UspA family protein
MTVLAGYPPEARGRGGLELARMLARSGGEPLVVCCVVPDRWAFPSQARVDAEYADQLRGLADRALDHAAEILKGTQVEYVVRTGRSVPATLLLEAREREARILTCGSSSHGSWGHIALGSVTDRLLHSSEVPLALAPRGFRSSPDAVVRRATVALDGATGSLDLLRTAARVAAETGARLRVVTFAVRGRTMYPPRIGLRAEDAVAAAWRDQAAEAQRAAVAAIKDDPELAQPEDVLIVDGDDWGQVIEHTGWGPGDVLVIGSSQYAPFARVFLGSTATRIVRHSPVPVIMVPLTRS